MFDRAFFERQFPDQIQAFCREQKIAAPAVELLLDDGSVLHLRAITQIRENWLSLKVGSDGSGAQLVLCPYFSIKRITFAAPTAKNAVVFSLPAQP